MPLSIGSLFSRSSTPKPEISGPIVENTTPKNCTLISSTCNVDGIVVMNRRSCSYDMSTTWCRRTAAITKNVSFRSSVAEQNYNE